MSKFLTVDIENLNLGEYGPSYKIVTFPEKVKILSAKFAVNIEAYGTEEQGRSWELYCMAGHPYAEEGMDIEWIWPIFGDAKPIIERSDDIRFVSDTVDTGVHADYDPAPPMVREVHAGVLDDTDYLVVWVQSAGGDFETITWEDTNAVITLEYEETTKATSFDQRDWWNWD